MDFFERISAKLSTAVDKVTANLVELAPNLLGGLVLLLLGWLVGAVAARLCERLFRAINALLDRVSRRGGKTRYRFGDPLIVAAGKAAFWLVFLLFVAIAAEAVGLTALSRWLSKAAAYLPDLLAAAVIVAVGVFASEFTRRLVGAAAGAAGVAQAELLGRMAQGAILVAALIIGLDQIEIDVTFLIIIVAVIVGGVLAGLSIAFGLGARGYVSNVIGAYEASRRLQVGQRVRVGDIDGTIVEVTGTAVVIATKRGNAHVPAGQFNEQVSLLLPEGRDNG